MSEMFTEFGYRHPDGHVTPQGVRYGAAELERTGGPRPDEILTEIDGDPVTFVKRFVTYSEWERVPS
jgi:hypothetical protein